MVASPARVGKELRQQTPPPAVRRAPRRLVVGMAGAPGATYTLGLLGLLRELEIESHLVTCGCSSSIIASETGLSLRQLRSRADCWYHEANQAAAISSGSFLTLGMVILPCTMRSLAAVVTGVADNLVQRAADVTMKEARRLVVVIAESEQSAIGRENLRRAEDVGIGVLSLGSAHTSRRVEEVAEEVVACLGIATGSVERPGPALP